MVKVPPCHMSHKIDTRVAHIQIANHQFDTVTTLSKDNFKILILDSERTLPSKERITTRILIVSQKELERDTTESKTKQPSKQK